MEDGRIRSHGMHGVQSHGRSYTIHDVYPLPSPSACKALHVYTYVTVIERIYCRACARVSHLYAFQDTSRIPLARALLISTIATALLIPCCAFRPDWSWRIPARYSWEWCITTRTAMKNSVCNASVERGHDGAYLRHVDVKIDWKILYHHKHVPTEP